MKVGNAWSLVCKGYIHAKWEKSSMKSKKYLAPVVERIGAGPHKSVWIKLREWKALIPSTRCIFTWRGRSLSWLQSPHSTLMNVRKLSLNLELFQTFANYVIYLLLLCYAWCKEKKTQNLTKTLFGLSSLASNITLNIYWVHIFLIFSFTFSFLFTASFYSFKFLSNFLNTVPEHTPILPPFSSHFS